MKTMKWVILTVVAVLFTAGAASAQKLAYINSQKILATYKEAQDSQERLNKIAAGWEEEAKLMHKQLQDITEQLDSQSLIWSDERKKEKETEREQLYMKIQQYQAEKFGPQTGEIYKKQEELLQPIYEKINVAIAKIAKERSFDFVFDMVTANIVYVNAGLDVDLTDEVLADLEKGLPAKTGPVKTTR